MGINLRARSSPDQNLTPVPMRGGAPAVQQTGPGQKHRSGAHRADAPNSAGNLSQPAQYFWIDFIAFDRVPTRNKQSVDLSAQFAKCLMRGDAQAAIGHERAVSGGGYDFDRVDRRRSWIFPTVHFRSAGEDLKWSNQVEDLDLRRGNKNDSARHPRRTLIHRLLTVLRNVFRQNLQNPQNRLL